MPLRRQGRWPKTQGGSVSSLVLHVHPRVKQVSGGQLFEVISPDAFGGRRDVGCQSPRFWCCWRLSSPSYMWLLKSRGNSSREKNTMTTAKRKSDRQRFPKPRSLDLLVIWSIRSGAVLPGSALSIRSIVYFTGFVKRRARCRNRRFFRDETYRLHQLGWIFHGSSAALGNAFQGSEHAGGSMHCQWR